MLEQKNPQVIFHRVSTARRIGRPGKKPFTTIGNTKQLGTKVGKDRVTVGLCCNASESQKLPLIFIGKQKKPRCFEKKTPQQHGYRYYSNGKAWMTSSIFTDWLVHLNQTMKVRNRSILLTLDNVSTHVHMELSNVKLQFLLPNSTASTQPLDAGIIHSFKRRYLNMCMINALQKH